MAISDIVNNVFTRPRRKSDGSFGLDEFAAEINKSGFARPSYFTVMITPPSELLRKDPILETISRSMPLRIEQAEMPNRSILSMDQRYYGPRRTIPYGFSAQQLTLTIILSEDMREREFFFRWQDLLMGLSRHSQSQNIAGLFDLGYYDTATKDSSVELKVYATSPKMQADNSPSTSIFDELSGIAQAVGFNPNIVSDPFGLNIFGGGKDRKITASYTVKLIEPYPFDINPMPLSWGDDGYGRMQVQMMYRYFTEEHKTFVNPSDDVSLARLVRDGVNSFNRFKPVFSLIKGQGIGGAGRAAWDQISGGARAAATAAVKPF